MVSRKENYHYKECGLPSVFLEDITVHRCECGAVAPEILGISFLHRHIGLDLIQKETLLSGEEIRYLRKLSGLNQGHLARVMDVAPETISRWENGKQRIGTQSDRQIRLIFFGGLVQHMFNHKTGQIVEGMAKLAKRVASLDIHQFLAKIEEAVAEAKKIRVHPEVYSAESGERGVAIQ
jgi:DNA-binding transcriptional regulator YiaG